MAFKKKAEIEKELKEAQARITELEAQVGEGTAAAEDTSAEDAHREEIDRIRREGQGAIDEAHRIGRSNAIEEIKHRYANTEEMMSSIVTFTDAEGEAMCAFLAEFFPHVPAPLYRLYVGLSAVGGSDD